MILLELSLKLCHCFILFCKFFSGIFDDEVFLLQTFIVFYRYLAVYLFDWLRANIRLMIERVLYLVFEWLNFDNAIVDFDRGVFSFDLWRKFLGNGDWHWLTLLRNWRVVFPAFGSMWFIAGLLYVVVGFGLVELWEQFEDVLQVGLLLEAHLFEWGALVFHQIINAIIRMSKKMTSNCCLIL